VINKYILTRKKFMDKTLVINPRSINKVWLVPLKEKIWLVKSRFLSENKKKLFHNH